jgi:hypothetical protein
MISRSYRGGRDGRRFRIGNNLLQRSDMALKCPPPEIGEANPDSASSIGDWPIDLDVAGVLQNGELFGEGGIGETEPIARK